MSEEEELSPEKRRYFFAGGKGRAPGMRNKDTLAKLELARLAKESPGMNAQEFLYTVMRDEKEDMDRRITAAGMILPTTHPRLQALKVENKPNLELDMTPDQIYARLIEVLIRSGAINPRLLTPTSMGIVPKLTSPDVIDGEMEEVEE